MLDIAFCEHRFIEGENKHSLIEKLKDAINLLSEMKNELLNSNILFSSYVEHLEKTVLRQIIRSSRERAYHIFDSTPTPLRLMQISPKSLTPYSNSFLLNESVLRSLLLSNIYGKNTTNHPSLETGRELTHDTPKCRMASIIGTSVTNNSHRNLEPMVVSHTPNKIRLCRQEKYPIK